MSETQDASRSGWRRRWPLIKKILTYVFFVLVAGLLVGLARNVDWPEVYRTLSNYNARTLWLAGAATFGSYAVYCSFDVLGKRYAQHNLPVRQIVPVTFVCYAFNLNLSAWVGGIALRYRLYSRLGLRASQITRVFTLSVLTNWLGYIWLAGLIFSLGWITPPESWEIGDTALRMLGAGLLLLALVYLWACGFSKRRHWTIRKHQIHLPSLRLAALQMLLGAANWSLMALVVYFMLSQQVAYPTVLGILMISSIAGVIAHIPAGLGVIEAVFVAALGGELSNSTIVAGLIGYRVVYFLVPLCLATMLYVVLEARAKKLRSGNEAQPSEEKAPGDHPSSAQKAVSR
ncbi:lysylphosphatidylglycerol synthase domain-containing protein [Pseudomonas sp. KSR10]|uniref:Membrane protein n=1 Tax=Stutzerimonas stutzeri TaxID=316 RepID=A0A0D9ARA7_STUST|nr:MULTISPECIES: lysylphosphatidylglycerol synthase domain-containing protein [Pseudomonadaceae]KJH81926.1 membrane protein [Stutzerimonas stutzeri]MCG6538503.1 lysylphosphatidylglycerol synthase domain-containing protein [Pseudomonas sp. KSR10]